MRQLQVFAAPDSTASSVIGQCSSLSQLGAGWRCGYLRLSRHVPRDPAVRQIKDPCEAAAYCPVIES